MELLSSPIERVFEFEFGRDNVSIRRIILCSASAFANILSYPMELVKMRMMVSQHNKYETPLYKNPKSCLKEIYGLRGVKGLYQGLGVSLLQNFLGLATIDIVFGQLSALDTLKNQSAYVRMLMSCILAETLIYPIDTIK
jgi:hypothetical protein